jgi:predicted GIY-YIG superfamily endonuclease
MSFWAYMLHCADRSFYLGHTDDIESRMAQHHHGEIKGYTSKRLPVTLVWSQAFPTRYEALQAERQIKGWSRAKKLALIRGDWKLISALARNRGEREGLRQPRIRSGAERGVATRSATNP